MKMFKMFLKTAAPDVATAVSELDAHAERLAALRTELDTAKSDFAQTESKRQQHVVAALVEGDQSARKALEQLDAELDRKARRVRDLEFAVHSLEAVEQELTRRLSDAEGRAKMDAALAALRNRQRSAEKLDTCLDALLSVMGEIQASCEPVVAAQYWVNPSETNRFDNNSAHRLLVYIEAKVNACLSNGYMVPRGFEGVRTQTFAEFDAEAVEGWSERLNRKYDEKYEVA